MLQLNIEDKKITVRLDSEGTDWKTVVELLNSVGMRSHTPEEHKRAFEASHTVVFLYDREKLIGFGRAISDGVYQAAIYDLAVDRKYQGLGLGKFLVENILSGVGQCNVILYASPGKETFYQQFGFRRMKTGMALFTDPAEKLASGFIE